MLPGQHLRMLPISLFYSDVTQVTAYISLPPPRGVVLHIGVSLHPTPIAHAKNDHPPGRAVFFMDEV